MGTRMDTRPRPNLQADYDVGVVAALLAAYPGAATRRDDEKQTPLDLAISYGLSSAAALAALVAADMPIDASGAPAPHHQSSLAKVVTMPRMAVRIALCLPLSLSTTRVSTLLQPYPSPRP